jgi:hypothetical protein
MNYQSKLLTAEDFEEATADSLITNVDNKKLFGAGTGIATSASNYPAANILVKQGVTAQVIKATVTAGAAGTVSIAAAAAANGLTLTAGANVAFALNETKEITLGTVTTTAAATLGQSLAFTISGASATVVGGATSTTFAVEVSNYPDVIELGERDAAVAPAQYRFVNVGLSVTGPSTLIESFPTSRASVLLTDNTNGLVLFNQTGSIISEANAKLLFGVPTAFIQDGNGDHNDPQDLFTDGAGLNRSKLAITSTTVAGTYTLRFVVDSLVKEVKIQINNAQPKVFVLSGTDLVDGNDVDALPNNVVTSGGPSKVFAAIVDGVQGNTEADKWQFASSGSAYAQLQIYDQDGILPNAANFVPSLNDKFVAVKDGVYTFEAPNTTTLRDILFARIAVADIALGDYTYAISKEYPDGRIETYSDTVEVTALDNNQLAVFGGAPTKFTNNWIINETSYKVGTYKYSFTLGATTLAFQVVITEKPTLNITKLMFGTTQLNLFEGNYILSKTALTATKVALTANFELDGLTSANYYTVTAVDYINNGPAGRTDADSLAATDLPVSYQTLLDATTINLGMLADATPNRGEYVEYTIKFFSKSGTTYTQVGEDKIVNVMVNENVVLSQPYITLSNDGLITEQAEAGEVITVRSTGAIFVSPIVQGNFVLTGLPAGVTQGATAVNYIDPNTVTITLTGNATNPYATVDITLTLTIAVGAFTVSPGASIVGTIKLLNNVAIANPVFAPLNAATAQPLATKTITLTFTEALYIDNAATPTLMASPPAAGLFVVKAGTTTLTEGATANNLHYVVTRTGNVITITIGANLAVSTVYEVTVGANKIFDVKGNALPTQTVSFTSAAS